MNAFQSSLLGIRIVSIYLVAQGISNIPDVYLFITSYSPEGNYSAIVLGSILSAIFSPLLIGTALWFIAPRICKYIVHSNKASETNSQLNVNQFQTTVIVLIGIYLVATKLPYSISLMYQLFTDTIEVNGKASFKEPLLFNTAPIIMQLFLGLLLIFGSNSISMLLLKLRTFGLSNK